MKNLMMNMMLKAMNKVAAFRKDERGVDIIVMIVVLAILMVFVGLFRDQLTEFINKTFADILSY